MKEVFAVAASALAIIGYIPYLRDTYTRRIEPHSYTWLIWCIVSLIMLAGQVVKGAGVGAIPTAFSLGFSLTIFFYSLRFGTKNITRTDTLFLSVALLAVIPWILTKDPTLSVIVAVGIDLVAFVPTIRKTWDHPRTERLHLYLLNTARHVLSLLSLEAYNVATALHSVTMVIANALMTTLILRRNHTYEE